MMKSLIVPCLLLVVWPGPALQVSRAADAPSFEKTIAPLIKEYCAGCHNEKTRKAKFRIDDIQPPALVREDIARWEKVREMVSIGDMPPEDKPQPTPEQKAQLIAWIDAHFAAMGKDSVVDLSLPQNANRIDHEPLFSGEHKGPAYTTSRVWRISPYIYGQLFDDLELRDFAVPLTTTSGEGFDDYASLYADEATIGTMMLNAKRVAVDLIHGQVIPRSNRNDKIKPGDPIRKTTKHKTLATFAAITGEPTKAQMQEAVRYAFNLFLQREPDAQELERYVTGSLEPNVRAGGNEAGLRGFLVTVMLSPEFLFRMELGLGKELPDGRRMLSPRELAYALSFALYDHVVPSLFQAAEKGKLTTREDVAREARRLLDERKLMRGQTAVAMRDAWWPTEKNMFGVALDRKLRFFQEYFGYTKATDVFKDDFRHGGAHEPRLIIRDANWLVLKILSQDKRVLEELLTTTEYPVAYRHGKNNQRAGYASVYNLEPGFDSQDAVTLPATQRAGMLTHPAWLVAHSGNFDNDPVRRGKWIQEHLLGGVVPDIPIGVEAQLPEAPQHTLRQRFNIVKEEYCWRCHKKMNPLGDPFEAFDDFGRYRTKHHVTAEGVVLASDLEINRNNRDLKAEPKIDVDTTGHLAGTGDPMLDGPVKDAVDLAHRLAKSPRVRQVFIRHVFRYWMGRNETYSDSPTLMAMDKAYVDSDGSISAPLVALFSSDSFLYRK